MTRGAKSSTKDLETKFAQTAFRLTQERNDFLLPQVLDFVRRHKWLNLRPEYQRRLVWDIGKRSLFLESLLLNIPIPPLFLYEWELGRYEVMDGQQRLTSVVDFYANEFALKGLEIWSELNGLRYKDLPKTLRRGLDRRRLSATVLLVESEGSESPNRGDIRKLVFERLNTGGLQLNAQELRNCLHAGPFNELLIRLSRTRLFARMWDIPPYEDNVDRAGHVSQELASNRLYQRMYDCEIVLRFFAFRQKGKIKGSVRSMLDGCMERNVTISDADTMPLESDFNSRLHLAHAIFGAHAFRYRDDQGAWRLSQPLYDAVMVALDRLWEHRARLRERRVAVVRQVGRLLANPKAYAVIVGRPNTARAIRARIDRVVRAMRLAARI